MVWTRDLYLPRHPMGLSMGIQRHKREPTTTDYYRIRTRTVTSRRRFRGGHPTFSTLPHGRRPAAVAVPSRLRSLTSTIITGPIHQPSTPSLLHAAQITCMCPDGADVPIRLGLSVPIHSGRHSDE